MAIVVEIDNPETPLGVAATEHYIYTVNLVAGDTEYSQVLPENFKALTFKARQTTALLRYSFTTGKVAASIEPFMSLPANFVYNVDNVKSSGTLYLASPTAGTIVEIEVWA